MDRFSQWSGQSIFFVHAPKTAGVSFVQCVARLFPSHQVFPFIFAEQFIENLSYLADYRFFHGHVPSFFEQLIPVPTLTVTLLREPITRALSAYEHIARTPTHPGHARFVQAGASLRGILDDPVLSRHVSNVQTKLLGLTISGPELAYVANDELPVNDRLEVIHRIRTAEVVEQTLATAQSRLSEFFFVGFQEDLNRSIGILHQKLGVPAPPLVPKENTTPDEQRLRRSTAYSDRELEALRKQNEFDIRLYAYARNLFADTYPSGD